ncbi:hypothetical protein TYRP_010098 [Tyrophagus putrescentiae]|nr:hypothetical protein TYRP_010098 [Tyrophagus putrescentiae]
MALVFSSTSATFDKSIFFPIGIPEDDADDGEDDPAAGGAVAAADKEVFVADLGDAHRRAGVADGAGGEDHDRAVGGQHVEVVLVGESAHRTPVGGAVGAALLAQLNLVAGGAHQTEVEGVALLLQRRRLAQGVPLGEATQQQLSRGVALRAEVDGVEV